MKALILIVALAAAGCATNKYEAKEIVTKDFQVKGNAIDGKVGLNGKNQLVIKREHSITFELQVQDLVNMRLQDKVNSELHMLKLCRRHLADPRLGGNGKVGSLPAVDQLQTVPELREEMGIDEDGNLKIVTEEYLEERLRSEREFEKSLRGMIKVAESNREECEALLTMTRFRLEGVPDGGKEAVVRGGTTPYTIYANDRG